MKKRKFFKKILYAYIFIIFVYTIIAVGLYFYKSNQINTYKIANNQISSLKQFKNKADSSFNEGFKLINQLYSNDYIVEYINNKNLDYYNITKSYETLLKYPLDGVPVVGVSKLDEIVISSYGTRDIKNFFEEIGYKGEKDITKLKYNQYYIFSSKEARTGKGIITLVKKYITVNQPALYFFISYNKEKLFPTGLADKGDDFAILRGDKLVTGSKLKDNKKWSDLLTDDIVSKITKENGKNSFNNSGYNFRYFESEMLKGLRYVYVSPRTIASNSIKKLLYGSLYIYLLLIVSGGTIVFYYSQYIYLPISETLNLFKGFAKESDRDEFSYIQENIKSIRQANRSLRDTIKNNSISLKTKFLRDLTYGLIPANKINERITRYEICPFKNKISAIILELVNFQHLNEEYTREAILKINNDILLILSEQLRDKKSEVFELNYKQYGIFIEEDNIKEIKNTLNKALAAINTIHELEMIAAIGQPVKTIMDIHLSAYSALTILEHRSPTDKRLIISYQQLDNMEHGNYYYPLEVERNIINYVIEGKLHDVKIIIANILKRNFKTLNMDREVKLEFIYAIVGTIYRVLHKINVRIDNLFDTDNLYDELRRIKEQKELEDKIIELFTTISNSINTEKEDQEKTFAEQFIDYIEQNYSKDISLVDLAEEFNYSTGYISRLFKSHVKENFKDYLNRYRINKAKEFMEQDPDRKIKAVAEMVGYSTVTFIRNFKKYEGISPGQYLDQKRHI